MFYKHHSSLFSLSCKPAGVVDNNTISSTYIRQFRGKSFIKTRSRESFKYEGRSLMKILNKLGLKVIPGTNNDNSCKTKTHFAL